MPCLLQSINLKTWLRDEGVHSNSFLEAKLLNHHVNMENSLEGLRQEVRPLSSRVAMLEVSIIATERLVIGDSVSGSPVKRKRTGRV